MDLIPSAAAIGLFAWAAASDLAARRIPNRLVLCLALLGLARLGWLAATGGGLAAPGLDLAAAVLVFGLGAVAFRLGVLGGGDVKLLAAAVLWVGVTTLGPFLLVTALAGAVLALTDLVSGWLLPAPLAARAATLPYGVAIAAAGILATTGTI